MNSDSAIKPLMPAETPVKVTVIVPVRNDPDHLRQCLDALSRSILPAKIIVVDDASTDCTADIAKSSGATVLRLEKQCGPAVARNRGAELAASEILFFVDADVLVHPDSIERVIRALAASTGVDAVFGSYDLQPGSPNFCSQYKNLFHRYVHQAASAEASTFWSGCGAMRREAFFAHGGFSANYERPCIEDIELGMRLKRAGQRIVLDKQLQATHLKTWTMAKVIRSDVFDRAIPWARLIVGQRSMPNDLNVGLPQRVGAMLACLAVAAIFVGSVFRPTLLLLPPVTLASVALADAWSLRTRSLQLCCPLLAVLAAAGSAWILWTAGLAGAVVGILALSVVVLNARFYLHWLRLRGWAFAVLVLPMHLLYFVYSAGALAWVTITQSAKPHTAIPTMLPSSGGGGT